METWERTLRGSVSALVQFGRQDSSRVRNSARRDLRAQFPGGKLTVAEPTKAALVLDEWTTHCWLG